ncbi:hypothetical protein J7F03_21435 [Streptomyces sp. ISL-43]|uniref:hypothetical protein n=1 Tax=Streptomyces sp. ISL-43 TaxID=2819183 RepID=UPI001BEC2B42|nr:hypothetical protein [Streptomyces sp. ISL-43]MBT2449599.1 hypothetical protein [Streptomyces sp. ISL-43]
MEALDRMIVGNLHRSYIAPRHNGRGHIWAGHTTTVILTPHRTLYRLESRNGLQPLLP